MGEHKHKISNVDVLTQTGDCSSCGRVSVKPSRKGKYWACRVAASRQWARWSSEGKIPAERCPRDRGIELLGGKCVFCGYCRCRRALHFHHVDPKTKEFGIGGTGRIAWERALREIKKCILVCANCHAEIHGGLILQDQVLEVFDER